MSSLNAGRRGNLRLTARLAPPDGRHAPRSATTSSPSRNETLDRFLTGIDHRAAGPRAWASSPGSCGQTLLGWSDVDRVRDHVRAHRAGHHGRLPPPVHAPLVQDRPAVRGVLAVLGSAAIEGPVISLGRRPPQAPRLLRPAGRPAQPHVDHGHGCAARCAACCTRTSAGCSSTPSAARKTRYAPDLIADPVVTFVDRTFVLWAIGGLVVAVPARLGRSAAPSRPASPGCCGAARCGCSCCTTSTYSINSLCHFFGRQRFETGDESRNLALAVALHVRRGVAQQPPRVPDLGARTACAAGSSTRRPG